MKRTIVVVYPIPVYLATSTNSLQRGERTYVKRLSESEWFLSWMTTNCCRFRDQCDLMRLAYPGVRIWEEFS